MCAGRRREKIRQKAVSQGKKSAVDDLKFIFRYQNQVVWRQSGEKFGLWRPSTAKRAGFLMSLAVLSDVTTTNWVWRLFCLAQLTMRADGYSGRLPILVPARANQITGTDESTGTICCRTRFVFQRDIVCRRVRTKSSRIVQINFTDTKKTAALMSRQV